MEEKNRKNFFSEWLEKLQQESWQLELLISGLALFGLWESRNFLSQISDFFRVHSVESLDFYANSLQIMLEGGWILFMINLIGHITVRGLWIGAIGLRYVSGDVDYAKLGYSDTFNKFFGRRLGSFDDYIERLEKVSSVIFSFTFLLFFLLCSLIMTILFFALSGQLLIHLFLDAADLKPMFYTLYGIMYFGLGFIVLIDFLTLGPLKKINDRIFSRIYLVIFRFFSLVSFSFLYRSLLLNFIDNSYTRKFFFGAIPYSLIILIGVIQLDIERYTFIPNFNFRSDMNIAVTTHSINYLYYDDQRDEFLNRYNRSDNYNKSKIRFVSLSHYENEQQLNLFLEYLESDNELMTKAYPNLKAFKRKGIYHGIFNNVEIVDERVKELQVRSNKELRAMRSILKDGELPTDSISLALISDQKEIYLNADKEDELKFEREIKKKYLDLKRNYQLETVQSIKDALAAQYRFVLDTTVVTDSLPFYFYTHPNLGERGLLCHIDINNIDPGAHALTIYRRVYEKDCELDCPEWTLTLPFYKK